MSENYSTPKTREEINERIRMSVRERTISIEVSEKLIELCKGFGTTPDVLFKGFIEDVLLDHTRPYDAYAALFHQAAFKYLSIAHGRTRIIQNGKYTERPEKRTFN